MKCLKCIIKCLYQLVFKFGQFLDNKLTKFMNYCQFCDFGSSKRYLGFLRAIILSLRLNKNITDPIECLKCIIICMYQLVFKFSQFLGFKLTYLLNYCQFCDFSPSEGHFWLLWAIILSLRLNKKNYGHHGVLEMFYKMFVSMSFQVWPIFSLQIDIFAELLPIL